MACFSTDCSFGEGADRPPMIEPWHDKSELVRVPTIYDIAHQAGLENRASQLGRDPQLRDHRPRVPRNPKPAGEIERELIAAGRS
jgi:hypothetical protein